MGDAARRITTRTETARISLQQKNAHLHRQQHRDHFVDVAVVHALDHQAVAAKDVLHCGRARTEYRVNWSETTPWSEEQSLGKRERTESARNGS